MDALQEVVKWWADATRPIIEDRISALHSQEEQLEAHGKTRQLRDVRKRIANLETNLRAISTCTEE